MSDFTNAFSDGKFDMNDVSNIAGKLLGGNAGGIGGMLGGLFK